MTTTRYAIVGGVTDAERIAPYLPANYQIAGETENGVIISGEDNAGWGLDTYVIPRLGSGLIFAREITENQATTALADARIESAATEITDSVTEAARGSGEDPIAWVTGNAYMPPLRSFAAAEQVWQDSPDGEDFARLAELVEARLAENEVALECPDYDNALYAVDTRRFEYVEDPGDHETLQQDWQPKITAGAVQVKRDGIVQETFNSPDPVQNSNDAFQWLLKHQGQSVDHATRHEGWEITDPAPCPACGCHHEGSE